MQKSDIITITHSTGVPTLASVDNRPRSVPINLAFHNNLSPKQCDDRPDVRIDGKLSRFDMPEERLFPLDSNIFLNLDKEYEYRNISPNQTHKFVALNIIPCTLTSFPYFLHKPTEKRLLSETVSWSNECNKYFCRCVSSADSIYSRSTAGQFLISSSNDYVICNSETDHSASASTLSNNDEKDDISTVAATYLNSNVVDTSSSENVAESMSTPTSIPSFVLKTISKPSPENTHCDKSCIVDRKLNELPHTTTSNLKKQEEKKIAKSAELVKNNHAYFLKRKQDAHNSPSAKISKTSCIIDLTESMKPSKVISETSSVASVPFLEIVDLTNGESSSFSSPQIKNNSLYEKLRNRNNMACKKSRMKQKANRDDIEKKIAFLTNENEVLRNKIKKLELEIEVVRSLVVLGVEKNAKEATSATHELENEARVTKISNQQN